MAFSEFLCGGPDCFSPPTLTCGDCRQAHYCGRPCALAAWHSAHKAECAALATARRRLPAPARKELERLEAGSVSAARAAVLLRTSKCFDPVAVMAVATIAAAARTRAGAAALIAAEAPLELVFFARNAAAMRDAGRVQLLSRALARLASTAAGEAACIQAGAPAVLIALLSGAGRGSAAAAGRLAFALASLTGDTTSQSALIKAGAPAALVAALGYAALHNSAFAAMHIADALGGMWERAGQRASVLAGLPEAAAAAAQWPAVRANAAAVAKVARVLTCSRKYPEGIAASIAAGAPALLVGLLSLAPVLGSADALASVACALGDAGEDTAAWREAVAGAGAGAALAALLRMELVQGCCSALTNAARAVESVAGCGPCRRLAVVTVAVPVRLAMASRRRPCLVAHLSSFFAGFAPPTTRRAAHSTCAPHAHAPRTLARRRAGVGTGGARPEIEWPNGLFWA